MVSLLSLHTEDAPDRFRKCVIHNTSGCLFFGDSPLTQFGDSQLERASRVSWTDV